MKADQAIGAVRPFLVPVIAWMVFAIQHRFHLPYFDLLLVVMLIISTLEAVKHAETIAHRLGEPFGTLVLALSVTAIEASLIISMMQAGGDDAIALARDTVFAAIMIILNGMIGLSLIVGSIRHKTQSFLHQGVNATLTALVAVSVLTLILPNFTVSASGPSYSAQQLLFVSVVALIIYASFIFVQNFKHKSIFVATDDDNSDHAGRPGRKASYLAFVLLLACLGAVVFLAESLAPGLDHLLASVGAPHSLAGVVIACIVLLPEGLSAYLAAKKNQLQKSLNLALGSALASISLTIPIVAFYAVINGFQLVLGIDAVSTILFMLSLFITILSFSTGKTTILQGIILFVVFLVYIFTIIFP